MFLLLFCPDLTIMVDWALKKHYQSEDIYPIVLLLCTKKKQGRDSSVPGKSVLTVFRGHKKTWVSMLYIFVSAAVGSVK